MALIFSTTGTTNKQSLLAVGAIELVEQEIGAIAERLDLVLTTADLAIGGKETYTAKWASESAYQLMTDVDAIEATAVINEHLDTQKFLVALDQLSSVILEKVSDPETNDLLSAFDAAARDCIDVLSAAKRSVGAAAEEVRQRANTDAVRSRSYQLMASAVFAALVLMLSMSGISFVVRPLEHIKRASDAERADVISGKSFRWAPTEIKQLAQSLQGFLNHLDATVKERTSDLEREKSKLEAEVAQRKLVEHDLSIALTEAQKASQAKSEFLSVTSHELRTPLNTIMATLELLNEADLNDAQQRYRELAASSGEHLVLMLNDILDFSTAESGNVDIQPTEVSLPVFVKELGDQSATLCKSHNIELTVRLHEPLPELVRFDARRFRQIVDNLVGNAIKYTDKSPIEMVIECSEVDSDLWLSATVADNGVGISQEFQDTIFEPFSQVDSSLTRASKGVGLGLALCRSLARAMSGDCFLAANEKNGKGSRFTVKIPVERCAKTAEAPAASQNQHLSTSFDKAPTADRLQILLVEDSEVNAILTSALLEQAGHSVTIVSSGELAIERCNEMIFDIVLMDLQMPGIDGFETTAIIKKTAVMNKATPIVCLSANVGGEFREHAQEVGMVGFVSKPVKKVELLGILDTITHSV